MQSFELYLVDHLLRISSDHAPLLLNTSRSSRVKKKIFHFEDYWFDNRGCHNAVLKA